jgi:hypothetical protein
MLLRQQYTHSSHVSTRHNTQVKLGHLMLSNIRQSVNISSCAPTAHMQ